MSVNIYQDNILKPLSGGRASDGHTIVDENDVEYSQREKLKITGATVTDDSANNATVVAISSGDIEEDEIETTFSADGKTITEAFSSGTKTTVFNDNGTITETYPDGRSFLTTFNSDGSISKEEITS